MHDTTDTTRRTLRLPQAESDFIATMAATNLTSVNAEIVRSVRERMQRERPQTKTAPEGVPAPAEA